MASIATSSHSKIFKGKEVYQINGESDRTHFYTTVTCVMTCGEKKLN